MTTLDNLTYRHYAVVKCPRCGTEYNPTGRTVCPGNIGVEPVTKRGIPCGTDVPKFSTVGEPVVAEGVVAPAPVIEDEEPDEDDEE